MASRKVERAGDFDELFLANYAALARLLHRVVGEIGSAEELAAEAFWKLHRQPPASGKNLIGWLYRTGLHLALDHLRKHKRREHYEGLSAGPAAMPTPEEAFLRLEQQVRVRNVLAGLKSEQASLLVLRSEGYSLAEIASLLSVAVGSVGTMLARADMAFRKEYLNRYGER